MNSLLPSFRTLNSNKICVSNLQPTHKSPTFFRLSLLLLSLAQRENDEGNRCEERENSEYDHRRVVTHETTSIFVARSKKRSLLKRWK